MLLYIQKERKGVVNMTVEKTVDNYFNNEPTPINNVVIKDKSGNNIYDNAPWYMSYKLLQLEVRYSCLCGSEIWMEVEV